MMDEFYDCPQLRQGELCEAVYGVMESMIGRSYGTRTERSVRDEVCTTLCGGVTRSKQEGTAEMFRSKPVVNPYNPSGYPSLEVKVRPFVLVGRFTCVNCHKTKEIDQMEPDYTRRVYWDRNTPKGWFNGLCDDCNSAATEAAEQARKNALEQRAGKRD